jgi:hypothetical protein
MLRRIFGLKRDEMVGGWRKLYDELHNFYCLPRIIRMMMPRMRWSGHGEGEQWIQKEIDH